MRAFLAVVICLMFGFGTACQTPASASPAYKAYAKRMLAHPPRGARYRPDLERALNAMASAARARAGVPRLRASTLARPPARAQALEMIIGNFVGHHSRSGARLATRFRAFSRREYIALGENAARNRLRGPVNITKARQLFRQWLNSSGHKRNLMNPAYRYVSTGAVQIRGHLYAVQVFWKLAPRGKKRNPFNIISR